MEFNQEFNAELMKDIDKNYFPRIGDTLSNIYHPLVFVEAVYTLDRTSVRVNKNYKDHLAKHELINRTIRKREIIWDQHKYDTNLFPGTGDTREQRDNLSYPMYCALNDIKRFNRLYNSKYRNRPHYENRVVIGKKVMVRLNHSLCNFESSQNDRIDYISCSVWGGKYSIPLTKVINQGFVYHGNIYTDTLEPHTVRKL